MSRKNIKILAYCLFFLGLIFYPGKNQFIEYYQKEPKSFTQKAQELNFTLQPLPTLNATFPQEQISAEAFLVIDNESFTPIIAKNINTKLAPASTVKLMTALIATNTYHLDDNLIVKKIISEPDSMGLTVGERISVLNLLYGTLMYSANDAAYTLAQNYPAGGVTGFVAKMNATAKVYHLKNTHYVDPIGFDYDQQYTTAYDLALLSKEIIKNKILTNITSTKNITVTDADYLYTHELHSTNQLLGEIPGLGGLKTGTTEAAGQNLISYFKLKNHSLIIVVLKSGNRYQDTETLIDFLRNNLEYKTFANYSK